MRQDMGEEGSYNSIIGNGLRHYWPCVALSGEASLGPQGHGGHGLDVGSQGAKEELGDRLFVSPQSPGRQSGVRTWVSSCGKTHLNLRFLESFGISLLLIRLGPLPLNCPCILETL